jgi:hypothetical protein
VAMSVVFEFPPRLSFRRYVNVLSLQLQLHGPREEK